MLVYLSIGLCIQIWEKYLDPTVVYKYKYVNILYYK